METIYELFEDENIFCTKYIYYIQYHITGLVQNVLQTIYFEKHIKDAAERINESIIKIFKKKHEVGIVEGDMVTEFRQLRRFPILLGMFTEKLTDMKFLADTFDKWIEIMNVQEEYDQLRMLLLILDEET